MVVHSLDSDLGVAVVGGCSQFYNDAYTNICRFLIPISELDSWIPLNKKRLLFYNFVTVTMSFGTIYICVTAKNDDLLRATWYENAAIIRSWCVR